MDIKDGENGDSLPDVRIKRLVDHPGNRIDASEISVRVDKSVDESLHFDVNEKDSADDEYFDYQFKGKLYRKLRESFLVSNYSTLHRSRFRSYNGVLQERSRQLASFPYTIHPYSLFLWVWEILITVALGITLIRQPVVIAFKEQKSPSELAVELGQSILFLTDMFLNFRTGIVIVATDTIILDPVFIAKSYIKTWFVLDLVSTIPYDNIIYIMMTMGGMKMEHARIAKYFRLLGLLKIFRLSRVIRYMTRFQEALLVNSMYVRVINLHIIIFYTLHWLSCLHYLVADIVNPIGDREQLSWVTRMDLWDQPVFIKYINSVVRALSNMACLGYGTEVPRTPEDILCTILSILVGATLFALFIGNLSSILVNMDVAQKKYAEVLSQVMEYLRFKQVPKDLQQRVVSYYQQKYRRRFFDEKEILSNVSGVIRQELQMFNCRRLVEGVPFFQGLPQPIIQGIVARLKSEVYLPQDIIISTDTLGDAMFFIEHGLLSVMAPGGRLVATLKDGDFFGEMALITNERRNSTVVAASCCDVYRLERTDFEDIVGNYPEVYSKLAKLVEDRMKEVAKRKDTSINQ